MKIIIVGAGEVGYHIAQKLSEEKQDVLVIDKDQEKIRRVTENLDAQALLGPGTSPGMLKAAGVGEADMLVAATDSDEANLIACLLSRNINPHILKVARIRNREYHEEKDLFSRDLLGVDRIISPESVMVETIRSLMKVPGASDVVDFENGRVRLVGITIKPDSPLAGRRLLSFRGLEGKVLVGAIVRGDQVFIPHGEDTIRIGDLVYLVTKPKEMPRGFGFFEFQSNEGRRVMIVGAGETGSALAFALEQEKMSVKIIERDAHKCTALVEKLKRGVVIHGDGTNRDLLVEENVDGVDFFLAVTGDEEHNILMSLLARALGAKKTITRVNKLSYISLVSVIGIDTVISSRLSAVREILRYIRKGRIISVAPLKGEHAEVIEAEALETSDIVHVPLAKVKFPKGALVGAIIRREEVIIPGGDSVILPGDRLIILSLKKVLQRLEKLLTVKLDYF